MYANEWCCQRSRVWSTQIIGKHKLIAAIYATLKYGFFVKYGEITRALTNFELKNNEHLIAIGSADWKTFAYSRILSYFVAVSTGCVHLLFLDDSTTFISHVRYTREHSYHHLPFRGGGEGEKHFYREQYILQLL